MTLPANDAADFEGTPPPAVDPEPMPVPTPPAEHVEKPRGRVFTATPVSDIDTTEPAPDTPATIDAQPEPASAEVAVAEAAGPLAVAATSDWPHDFMDFEGDRLEIRLPDERALTGFALSVGKFIPPEVQNDMVSLFMNRHMSPDSYGQVMARMMDPDDATYTVKTVGQLFNSIVKASSEVRAEEAKAAELEAAKGKKPGK